MQTLRQIVESPASAEGHIPALTINDWPDLQYRGVVEGFYGTPWSHEVRLSLIDTYGRYKMNYYIYGPKDDPYHSSPYWREPYPADEAQEIRELVEACNKNRVNFVWAIHPGQDIKWEESDIQNLLRKFEAMYQLGVRAFAVHFDDIEGINKYHEDLPVFGQEKAMERINFGSRDGFRRPMCWNGEAYGGFSTVKPWISTHSRYQEVNLEADKASEKSVFRFFQNLLKLRLNTPAILYGTLNVVNKPEDPFFVFEREYEGEKYTVICNFEQESKIAVPENTEVVLQNYLDRAETFRPYEILGVKHH